VTTTTVRLGDIATARSGDKGTGANIGIIARDAATYNYLKQYLSAERVAEFMKPLAPGAVQRFELPNLHAFNFLLPEVLAGGGSKSLRIDAQGKTLGQVLLEMPVEIPEDLTGN
jgi:hypothetical protein